MDRGDQLIVVAKNSKVSEVGGSCPPYQAMCSELVEYLVRNLVCSFATGTFIPGGYTPRLGCARL